MSTRNIQYSIIRIYYKNAVEVCYGPDILRTLDLESSRYLSGADGAWLIARRLADKALHIARMLADSVKMYTDVSIIPQSSQLSVS